MEAPKDSIAFQAGEDDKAQGTAGADVHLVEAKDCFSELGTFSIFGRLAFQGPDIDPYLRFPLQVDVASMMKELGDLLELEPSEDEAAGVASRDQPALPGDVENFDAEGFMKGLGVYGTGSLGRMTASLCAKALLASRAVVGSARKDEHNFLAHSAEKARLLERISTLEKENKALENLRGSLTSENGLLKGIVSEQEETISKMQEKMSLDESVLENLRGVVERDAAKVVNLQTEVRQLKADVERKNVKISELEKEVEEDRVMWESTSQDILNKSAAICEEYNKALASFVTKPLPFPEDSEGGASGLLDWLLGEFEDLGRILASVSDNTAVMTCESVMAVLAREGCQELETISVRDYAFPDYAELEEEITKVQPVKKAFLRKFWKLSGRQVVQEAARRRLEEVRRAREAAKDVVEEGARLEDIAGGSVAGGSSRALTESDASQV
ncbi:hypothetical protein PVAP13_2KG348189 [Panicum virgatum]|uniref:Uncharacterized protein n=1 Tax=Panicum virgatum TaxID=38727 RepID=A0A8T0WD23_PANVG|nr:hypothetical protein PVAP13_2KG348189 [Panicum virgatum]